MQTVRLLFTFLMISFFSISAAIAGPLFIVEEDGNKYVMYLQFEDIEDVASVKIEGDFSKGKSTSTMEVSMSSFDVEMLAGSKAAIHTLSNMYDSANYVVIITKSDGSVLTYPAVQITLTDEFVGLAMAE